MEIGIGEIFSNKKNVFTLPLVMKRIIFFAAFQFLHFCLLGQFFDLREQWIIDSTERSAFKRNDTLSHTVLPKAFGADQRIDRFENGKSSNGFIRATSDICMAGGLFKNGDVNAGGVGFGQLQMEGAYKNHWYIQLGGMFLGGQLPNYVQTAIDTLSVLPGWGKVISASDASVKAFNWTGNLAYSPNRHFSFEMGHNKIMVGEGYRSLIVSRNAAPYFFARSTIKAGNFRLYSIWSQLQDIQNGWGDIRKKYTAVHGLHWKITPKFQLSVHEMVIWQRNDSTSVRNFDMHYLNPLLFWRPVEYAQGSADNVLLAMSGHYIHRQKVKFYFQFLLDEWLLSSVRARNGWWGLKYGGQFGVKYLDIIPGLNGLSEINAVRPFTYSHASSMQAWGSMNQPIAHPSGSNFAEWVNMLQYTQGNWKVNYQINYNIFGRNKGDKNYGGDIFMTYMNPVSQFGNTLYQGEKHFLMFQQFSVSRVMGVWGEIFTQFSWRNDKTMEKTNSDQWIMLGLRTKGFQFQPWDY